MHPGSVRRLASRAGSARWSPRRIALVDTWLWGVPSFRAGPRVLWGQDRLDVLAASLSG